MILIINTAAVVKTVNKLGCFISLKIFLHQYWQQLNTYDKNCIIIIKINNKMIPAK